MSRFAAPLRFLLCGTVASVLWAAPVTDALAAGKSDGLADADRVLRETAADNPQDAQPQRFGALVVLQAAARRATTMEGAKPTPDDDAKVGGYNRALQQMMREVSQTGAPNCQGNDCPAAQLRRAASELLRNEAFVRSVFERFATPEWRATHLAAVMDRRGSAAASAVPQSALSGATPVRPADSAAPPPAEPADSRSTGLPAPIAVAAAAPEPPRELRSASGVDMSAFGLSMGVPVSLPACPREGQPNARAGQLEQMFQALVSSANRPPVANACMKSTSAAGISALLLDGEKNEAARMVAKRSVEIRLPQARCPSWLHSGQQCSVWGMVLDGRLAAILAFTGSDMAARQQIGRDLHEKYGKGSERSGTYVSRGTTQSWETVTWNLKDLHVEFNSSGSTMGGGTIVVITAEGVRALGADQKRKDAARPRM